MESVSRKRSIVQSSSHSQKCQLTRTKKQDFLVAMRYHSTTETYLSCATITKELLHQNKVAVLNEMKQHFAIPSLQLVLTSIRARCWQCKQRSISSDVSEMIYLSRFRQAMGIRPFTYAGVDYFEPIMVKHKKRLEKRWCALFTCFTTRAIHIEWASSLSTNSFILVLKRFIITWLFHCISGFLSLSGAQHGVAHRSPLLF